MKNIFKKFFGFRSDEKETTEEYMNRVRRSKLERGWVKRYDKSRPKVSR